MKDESRLLTSTVFWAALLLLTSCVPVLADGFGRSGDFARTAGSAVPMITKEQAFYYPAIPWAYPGHKWIPEVGGGSYGIPAAPIKIATLYAEPDSGYPCGVWTGFYWNFQGLDTSAFEYRTAWGHQYGDMEILALRFGYGGQVDTVTEWLTGDTTITAGWIPMWALEHLHALANTEYSTVLGSLAGATRAAGSVPRYRAYYSIPRCEFLDSLQIWVRGSAGSEYNDFGGVDGLQEVPTQTVYMSADYVLLKSKSELYQRRMVTQARRGAPRNADLFTLARTPLGYKGGVLGLSAGVSPAYTLATNAPWETSAPYGLNFRRSPDANLDYSMLEEDQLFFLGKGESGGPLFTTLNGSHPSGGSTMRIHKPDSTKSWEDYVPLRARDRFRDAYHIFVIRDAADPVEGGGVFVSTALADCTTYWKATITDIVGEVTGGTFDQTYQDGDQCVLVSVMVAEGTGMEDFLAKAGFYLYEALHHFNWQGWPATVYTDVSYDSVLTNATTHLPVIGSASFGTSLYRIFGVGDNPVNLTFGPDERFTWAILKAKDFQSPHTLTNYTWRFTSAMTYYVQDGVQWYSPVLPEGVIADTIELSQAYIVDNSKNSWANVLVTADSSGTGVDSLQTISGVPGQLDWISLNLATGGTYALHRPILVFPTGSGADAWDDSLTATTHKVQDSVVLEVFLNGSSWNGNWLAGKHFADDSSYWSVVDLSEIPNYETVTSNYLKFFIGEDSLAGLKGSAYDYPSSYVQKLRWSLPAGTVRENLDTKLGVLWSTWDLRGIAPQISTGSASHIRRLYLLGGSYPDAELRTRLVVYSHSAAGAASGDTIVIRFSWFDDGDQTLESGESWVKDIELRSDTPTTNRDSDNPYYAGYTNTTPDRTFRRLVSLLDTETLAGLSSARDSIEGMTIVAATCSMLVASYDSSAIRSIYAFPVKHATANVHWVEPEATWNARSTGNNWQTAGGDYTTASGDTLAVFTTNTSLLPAPMATTNEWVVVDVQSLVELMAGSSVADSTVDGFILVASGNHPDTANSRIGFQPSDVYTVMSPNPAVDGAVSGEGAVIWTIIAVAN